MNKIFFVISIVLSVVLLSCKTPIPSKPDIYIGGLFYMSDTTMVGAYWKNGIRVLVPQFSEVTGITVSGNDVYVTGVSDDTTDNFYVKNGNKIIVPLAGDIKCLTVANNKVYVAGFDTTAYPVWQSAYWIDNKIFKLAKTDAFMQGINDNAIAVSGNDVYVGGFLDENTDSKGYWKNGKFVHVDSSLSGFGQILFNQNGMYAIDGRPGYYLNGNYHALSADSLYTSSSIAVSGNDVYIIGYSRTNAVYWKNDTMTKIPFSSCDGIGISGNDVYIVGNSNSNNRSNIVLWKNGIVQTIDSCLAYCMTIVNH